MFNLAPEVKRNFEAGNFAIRQKPSVFNGIWSDMATEKTATKDSKGNGGIINITRQQSALIRWSLTRHVLADFSSEMRQRSVISSSAEYTMHEETKPACLKRDEEHVQLLVDHIAQRMTNPFNVSSHPKPLINISTGMHASREIETSRINSSDDGTKMAKTFVNSAFSKGQSGNFYSPIPRSTLKTFEDLTKKTKLKCRSGEVLEAHINSELVFRRALVLANSRDDVTVEKVLSFPIGPIPTSLFHDDGTMRKCCKADLCHQLESDVTTVHSLEPFDRLRTVLIRDGMALIQSLDVNKLKTFGDLANKFIQSQLYCFSSVSCVVDVFDRYDLEQSIKSAERDRRSSFCGSRKVFEVIEGRPIPDWKRFLAVAANKQALIKFLGESIVQHYRLSSLEMSSGEVPYLSGASNHCQENLQRWSLRLPRVILYT
jgi:hypothetical protein